MKLGIQWYLQIMNSIDSLKLLAGLPIPMSDSTCFVHPKTLLEIAAIGVEKYFKYVNILTINDLDIKKILSDADISIFDFVFLNCSQKNDFNDLFLEALNYFIKEEIIFVAEIESFVVGPFGEQRFLTRDNFSEFQEIIKSQNFLNDKDKPTSEDEAAKRIKQSLAKSREKIAKIKGKSEEKIEISDLIASLAINTSLSIDRIWNITYYTFNDQFKRMRLLEQYDTGLQSILAGADPKKVKLEDWIKNIQ